MIRLSLIIATYNRSAALVEALRSVVRQDFPAAEWECIVVNNNSQDDTLARFEAFATEHPAINLRIVTETRQGQKKIGITQMCSVILPDGELTMILFDSV